MIRSSRSQARCGYSSGSQRAERCRSVLGRSSRDIEDGVEPVRSSRLPGEWSTRSARACRPPHRGLVDRLRAGSRLHARPGGSRTPRGPEAPFRFGELLLAPPASCWRRRKSFCCFSIPRRRLRMDFSPTHLGQRVLAQPTTRLSVDQVKRSRAAELDRSRGFRRVARAVRASRTRGELLYR